MTDTACPVCQTAAPKTFLDLKNLPIYCNLLWSDQQEARDCPKGDIRLVFCEHCGAITNADFDPSLLGYSQDYENSLHYSKRFQTYAQELAERLVEQHQLQGKKIVEIGCGKGDFLVSLCQLGNNTGIGFDNSYVERPEHIALGSQVKFVQDFYSEKYSEYGGDLVCCRQVLEHIQQPGDMLGPVRKTIGDSKDTAVFFEVPNALYTFDNMMIWDIIYEHCTYFTPVSLAYTFHAAGYRTEAVREEFGGQFISIEAYPVKEQIVEIDKVAVSELSDTIASFGSRFETQMTGWKATLDEMFQQGKKVVIWGSGSKGVTFLNLLDTKAQIEYAVDINPRKQGKFIPGTGQEIIAPERLEAYGPDVVIVMNPLYRQEIQDMLKEIGLAPDVLTTESLGAQSVV
ncbi:MAG: methyltransferase domain-containing protein [Cyanobacteria bacterium P01_D01_bin.36]